MDVLAHHIISEPFWRTTVTAGSAGWLIGLMVWLLPSAGSARSLIIIVLTYVIALCQFPHVVAGSVEAAYGVMTGHASVRDYLVAFLLPTLIGNSAGGTILAALLNHAPLAAELHGRNPAS
jgi:formate/nitrite transporter FocA (FNT family)